jgi:hypothetical protein
MEPVLPNTPVLGWSILTTIGNFVRQGRQFKQATQDTQNQLRKPGVGTVPIEAVLGCFRSQWPSLKLSVAYFELLTISSR